MESVPYKANLEIAHDLSAGDWIRASLAPWVLFSETPVTIGIVIPKGFESYLLIQHAHEGDITGNLGSESLTKLTAVLSKFTSTPEDCYHALWEGFGWTPPYSLPEGIIDAPRYTLPNRGYLLMRGPIEESNKLGWYSGESLHRQSPNILWPTDRQWILASGIDFNVTLLAGSEQLISAIENLNFFATQRFNVTDAIADLPVADY